MDYQSRRQVQGEATRLAILDAAIRLTRQVGFDKMTIRDICTAAGVTTGAFYRYYDSKEALFTAMVGEQAEYVLSMFQNTLDDFEKLPGDEQTKQMINISNGCIAGLMDYIYDNHDAFKLLIEHAEGTAYADFIHQLVVREVDSTYSFIRTLTAGGHPVETIHKNLVHMIASGLFTGIFEMIVHDMDREEADQYVSQLARFYAAGWSELLGVTFG